MYNRTSNSNSNDYYVQPLQLPSGHTYYGPPGTTNNKSSHQSASMSNPFVLPSSASASSSSYVHQSSFYPSPLSHHQNLSSSSNSHLAPTDSLAHHGVLSNKDAGSMLVDAAHSLNDRERMRDVQNNFIPNNSNNQTQKKTPAKRASTKSSANSSSSGSKSRAKPPKRSTVRSIEPKKSRSSKSSSRKSSRPAPTAANSSSDDSDSSSDESSSNNESDDSDNEPQSEEINPYMPPTAKNLIDAESKSAKEAVEDETDESDDWVPPPLTEDISVIHESFKSLTSKWPPNLKSNYERKRKEIFKSQLKANIAKPESTMISLLRRASKVYHSLSAEKHKCERDLIVALFAAELPRQLVLNLFDLSAWTIQRIVNLTNDGDNIGGHIDKWKAKVKEVQTTNPDGSVSYHFTSKTRNRICKLTGRTMKEEKEIAASYYDRPENVNKDIIAIYAQYYQDQTGGDSTKRAPLSRANFYQLAPEGKKRRRKPEVLRVECEHCEKLMRIRVEEEEIPTKITKKRKVKRLKQKPLTTLLGTNNISNAQDKTTPMDTSSTSSTAGAVTESSSLLPSDQSSMIAADSSSSSSLLPPSEFSVPSTDTKESDDELYETIEQVELIDGPPKKRIRVDVLKRSGQIVQADRELSSGGNGKVIHTSKEEARQAKKAAKSEQTANSSNDRPSEPLPLPLDQHGNPIYTKRGPGRAKKPKVLKSESSNLTQQMVSLLPFLSPPLSTLTEEQKEILNKTNIQQTANNNNLNTPVIFNSNENNNSSSLAEERKSIDAVIAAINTETDPLPPSPQPELSSVSIPVLLPISESSSSMIPETVDLTDD